MEQGNDAACLLVAGDCVYRFSLIGGIGCKYYQIEGQYFNDLLTNHHLLQYYSLEEEDCYYCSFYIIIIAVTLLLLLLYYYCY